MSVSVSDELRNVELSVNYRLWVLLRQLEWYVPIVGQVLTPVTAPDVITNETPAANTFGIASPDDNVGKPWVFLDKNGDVDDSHIVVYVNGTPLDPSLYSIDHLQGQVTLDSPASNVTADLFMSQAHVVEGYPDDEWLKDNELPVVAWFNITATGQPFAIGTSLEDRSFFFTIDILGNDWGEVSRLQSSIMHMLAKVDFVDMTQGQPLNADGSINTSFDSTAQFVESFRLKRRPLGKKLPKRQAGLDKERHRSVITVEFSRIS